MTDASPRIATIVSRTRTRLVSETLEKVRNRTYPPDGAWFETGWDPDICKIVDELITEVLKESV